MLPRGHHPITLHQCTKTRVRSMDLNHNHQCHSTTSKSPSGDMAPLLRRASSTSNSMGHHKVDTINRHNKARCIMVSNLMVSSRMVNNPMGSNLMVSNRKGTMIIAVAAQVRVSAQAYLPPLRVVAAWISLFEAFVVRVLIESRICVHNRRSRSAGVSFHGTRIGSVVYKETTLGPLVRSV